ncbi:MltR family transcriptional regulator [Citrobacter sedlakii]|uniref:MltR family transcriptional regulator n=1 Tax=Citrobacter sedlakii TaxID=67826 RepID=UPI0022B3DAA1|nr:MltR family transcriptional regulator [Citrobacter sedlakii]MCZ4673576.1 MltR family transcriptional regulator [Citrobacter sedlakii]MDR5003632.1 MltR family transcriptional regulator [Citrobacter sedlakii]
MCENLFSGTDASLIYKQYGEMLNSESDKGIVLIASSIIEESLKELITRRLFPSLQKSDPLFSGETAPLASLSAKIEMAYRLGIISDIVKNELNIFRKLRNKFAHNHMVISLNDPQVADQLSHIFKEDNLVWVSILNSVSSNLDTKQQFILYFAATMMALKRLTGVMTIIDAVEIENNN